jgi:hypothetical protein
MINAVGMLENQTRMIHQNIKCLLSSAQLPPNPTQIYPNKDVFLSLLTVPFGLFFIPINGFAVSNNNGKKLSFCR